MMTELKVALTKMRDAGDLQGFKKMMAVHAEQIDYTFGEDVGLIRQDADLYEGGSRLKLKSLTLPIAFVKG